MVNGNGAADSSGQRHTSAGTEPSNATPDKLTWKWIPGIAAANAALDEHPEMEALRKGQDLLTVEQFADALAEGMQEILMTSFGFALIGWGETNAGKTMNILTVKTDMAVADIGIQEIEAAAYERGAKAIIAMGRPGWTEFLKRHDYTIQPLIVARKELHGHSIS